MSESIVLGGGCFWCTEATYQLIEGVDRVVPGYAGGHGPRPSYASIHGSPDGWAETVRVTFNPVVISLEDILDIFWTIHDPTTPNRQGADVGPEYRSIILFNTPEQETIIRASVAVAQRVWDQPIVTEVKLLTEFYEAEPEHHNYFRTHPEAAYCQVVINPKLAKLKAKFAARLKK